LGLPHEGQTVIRSVFISRHVRFFGNTRTVKWDITDSFIIIGDVPFFVPDPLGLVPRVNEIGRLLGVTAQTDFPRRGPRRQRAARATPNRMRRLE
jgi:hypothetical protein